MKLKHITFTGIDEHTDVNVLKDIKKKYPLAEFGVLMSKKWSVNGNRYPSPEIINNFTDQGLDLSAHLCGGIAKDAYTGNFLSVLSCYPSFQHPDFKRVQLNVSSYDELWTQAGWLEDFYENKEVIIQQKSPTMAQSQGFRRFQTLNPHINVTMLIDPSGGKGVDDGLNIIATPYKTGYAGGINEDNVEEKLTTLMNLDTVGYFWIDMESGVRSDDWFDTDKVVRVLEKCEKVLKNLDI